MKKEQIQGKRKTLLGEPCKNAHLGSGPKWKKPQERSLSQDQRGVCHAHVDRETINPVSTIQAKIRAYRRTHKRDHEYVDDKLQHWYGELTSAYLRDMKFDKGVGYGDFAMGMPLVGISRVGGRICGVALEKETLEVRSVVFQTSDTHGIEVQPKSVRKIIHNTIKTKKVKSAIH